VTLTDPDLVAAFGGAGQAPLLLDSANEGYIHPPSLNHAVAAAVLRNGYISNANSANGGALAVNLTSERVRTAAAMIDGIRAGQSLSDLLPARKGPARSPRFRGSRSVHLQAAKSLPPACRPPEVDAVRRWDLDRAIKARNVVDGFALVEHIKATNNKTYPLASLRCRP
jgi:hypothetical protein